MQALLDGVHRQAQGGYRVDDDVVPDLTEAVGCHEFGLSELGHVGQQRNIHRGAELLKLADVGERFGEDEIRAGVGIGPSAIYGRGQPLDARRIGAGADHEIGVAPGRNRGV
ncbi:Uncharacterised protein [Mycobacteroides abscessus]|nr:Uncharacterised protein [Mycobacteroides abscessus]